MRHLPEICITLCGAIIPAALLLAWLIRRAPEYITVWPQDVPDGNPENL